MLGNGNGTFRLATTLDAGASVAVAVGDFNQDRNQDLATSNVSVLAGNGDGTFNRP